MLRETASDDDDGDDAREVCGKSKSMFCIRRL